MIVAPNRLWNQILPKQLSYIPQRVLRIGSLLRLEPSLLHLFPIALAGNWIRIGQPQINETRSAAL